MSREETPTIEFLAAHASSAVHRISVSFMQAGSAVEAAGQQIDQFICKRQVEHLRQCVGEASVVFDVSSLQLDVFCCL